MPKWISFYSYKGSSDTMKNTRVIRKTTHERNTLFNTKYLFSSQVLVDRNLYFLSYIMINKCFFVLFLNAVVEIYSKITKNSTFIEIPFLRYVKIVPVVFVSGIACGSTVLKAFTARRTYNFNILIFSKTKGPNLIKLSDNYVWIEAFRLA